MIQIKNNKVNLDNVHYKIYWAISIVAQLYEAGDSELVLTSVRDSKHSFKNSFHYVGRAFDCRIWNYNGNLNNLTQSIREALGDEFDVILESDHIHIEFDPKN